MRYKVCGLFIAFLTVSTLMSLSCAPAVDVEAEKAEVKLFLDRLIQAFKDGDLDFLATVYADDPDVIFFSAGAGDRFVGWDQFRDHAASYFEDETFQYEDLSMRELVIKVSGSGDAACFSSLLDETYTFQGVPVKLEGSRFTGALEKRDGNWVIVQQHFSIPVLDVSEVREVIEAQNLRFSEAVKLGDAAALSALYTEDAIRMPPNGEMIKGREAGEEFIRSEMQKGAGEMSLTTLDVFGSGDIAYEIGYYAHTIKPEGEEPVQDNGKYVAIWKRQIDGSWKLYIDIWNTSLPAQ